MLNQTQIQTTGGKDESNIVLCENRNGHRNTERRTYRHIIRHHTKKPKRWATPPTNGD